MINIRGTVQNNALTSKLLNELKTSKTQYKLFKKEEEREFIDQYLEKDKYLDGSDILDTSDPLYMKWALETNEEKRKNLYYRIRRVLKWKKDEDEFYHLLVMHNVRFVFNLSKKYCKNTVDYDNMIARGLFGLVKAANKFNPFSPVTKQNPENPKDKNDKIVVFDENGEIIPIKFNTYAKSWIFKYIVGEFMDKQLRYIDNYSDSLNATVRIKNSQTTQTLENFVDNVIDPSYNRPKGTITSVCTNETRGFYDNIEEYLQTTNELTSLEKNVIIDTYYNSMKTKDISEKLNMPLDVINSTKTKALKKLKTYIAREYNIKSFSEVG